ncbi:lytic transglycosylase domain-containing protein [Paraburkholderia dipogonis]|uniref:lytic transglycosylase domain-containing protein n=1 Tax=Paraburkholderia dipogonis TaxID=1211383 RepID=UPI0038BDCEA3
MANQNMTGFWGAALTGISSGLQKYQQDTEDADYLRQTRMQQLQAGNLANQQAAQQLAAQQQTQADAASAANYYRDASKPASQNPESSGSYAGSLLGVAGQTAPGVAGSAAGTTPNPFSTQQAGSPAPAGGAPMGSGVTAGSSTSGLKQKQLYTGPLSMDQLSDLDSQNGLPPGTMYGVFKTESGFNPGAVNPKSGAVGIGQVLPSTAARPGYGLRNNLDPRDPATAAQYMGALYKKFGGNLPMAVAAYDAGAGGDFTNPETRAYVPKVMAGAQEYNAARGLKNAEQAPTPADRIQSREEAGLNTPIPAYQGAVSEMDQQIQQNLRAAGMARRDGNMGLADRFTQRAVTLADQKTELEKKTIEVTEKTNADINKGFLGVHDQQTYETALRQLAQNPALRAATLGLNLTGRYDLDRNRLDSLTSRTQTLTEQQSNQNAQQRNVLEQREDARKQAKADREAQADADARARLKAQTDAAKEQEAGRRASAAQSGLPYVQSLSSLPGATPEAVATARKGVEKQWIDYDKGHETQRTGSQNVMNLSGQIHTMLTQNPKLVGGWVTTLKDKAGNWALSPEQQILVKSANAMVVEAQKMAAPGAQRSAATAAYAKILSTTKPNITMDPQAAIKVANDYYMMGAAEIQQSRFIDDFRQANPDAPPSVGLLAWRRYENSLGPSSYYDPKTQSMVPNTASIPLLPDGTDNPEFKDPHKFFAHGEKW